MKQLIQNSTQINNIFNISICFLFSSKSHVVRNSEKDLEIIAFCFIYGFWTFFAKGVVV